MTASKKDFLMIGIKNETIKQNQFDWPHWPAFSEQEIEAVSAVLRSNKVNYWTGEQCRIFEEEYANSVGVKYAVSLMNGTVALEAALYALNIGEGDEVITTSRTFIASASAAVMRGATPVLADVDPVSQNMTAKSIEAVLSKRTKAIIVVHLAGWPCEMDSINSLAKKHKLYVIEDCAQAHGALYQGKQVGGWGDVSAFSFCQDKIITTGGEGGMVTTNNKEIWEKIWAFKDHGKSYDAVYHREYSPGFRWVHESFGTNWRMTEMQAAIGRLQLKKLPTWIQIRQNNAAILSEAFAKLAALRLTQPPASIKHAYYKYYTFVRPELLKSGWNRDRIMQEILARGVPCFTGICSEIYREQAFINANLQPQTRFPVAKMLGETSLMFLVHPTLTEDNMQEMAKIITQVIKQASHATEEVVI